MAQKSSNIWATFVIKFVTKIFQKAPIMVHIFKIESKLAKPVSEFL